LGAKWMKEVATALVGPPSSENSSSFSFEGVTRVLSLVVPTLSPPRSAEESSRFAASSPLREGLVSSLSPPRRGFYDLPVSRVVTHNPRGPPRRWVTS